MLQVDRRRSSSDASSKIEVLRRARMIHSESAVRPGRGVRVGRAGGRRAGVVRADAGARPSSARSAGCPSAATSVLAQLHADRGAEPVGQALPAGGAEVAEGHDAAAAPAVDRRLSQPDRRGRLRRRRNADAVHRRRPDAADVRLLALVLRAARRGVRLRAPERLARAARPRCGRSRFGTVCPTRST